ncbi:MAG TPA: ABC transporter permease [Dehalococcoidia bacterium]|nr:ABC transporter permease [Dehalococcoidia bacterium]
MRQISAAYTKTVKELLREKAALFWTIAWPIIFVIIGSVVFTGSAPQAVIPYIKGSIAISMMVFALMIAGMSNLPASIAGDRANGLLSKLISMHIKPYKDFIGRIFAVITVSLLAAALVIAIGIALGARFTGAGVEIPQAIGFVFLVICASAGVGLIAGTLIKNLQGAIMTGVGIAVITSFISGLFAPYEALPVPLQTFARVYPISSAQASIVHLLAGPDMVAYNPLTSSQVTLTIALSFALLFVGTILYSRLGWKLD